MALASEFEASLRELGVSAAIEIRESGRVARLSRLSWEVRGSGEKPLLHLWSEDYNVTRRVLAITDHSDQRLELAVERFGHRKPDRLEFVRVNSVNRNVKLCAKRFARGSVVYWRSNSPTKPWNPSPLPLIWNTLFLAVTLAACNAEAPPIGRSLAFRTVNPRTLSRIV